MQAVDSHFCELVLPHKPWDVLATKAQTKLMTVDSASVCP